MNRLDRLYALVEELRAAGSLGRSAPRLAERFEVSVRTIERDILALQEAGVPVSAQLGRRGGYVLDRSMTLPPLNFTPAEAVAMAVGLRRLDDTAALVVVPRLPVGLVPSADGPPIGPEVWGETVLRLPDGLAGRWENVFTGETPTGGESVAVAEALGVFPVAVLVRQR